MIFFHLFIDPFKKFSCMFCDKTGFDDESDIILHNVNFHASDANDYICRPSEVSFIIYYCFHLSIRTRHCHENLFQYLHRRMGRRRNSQILHNRFSLLVLIHVTSKSL